MNRYQEMCQHQQEEFNALPLGFAFSNAQFDEMMRGWGLDPEKDVDKLFRLPGGGFVQKKDADLLHKTRERHDAELAAAIEEDKSAELQGLLVVFPCKVGDTVYVTSNSKVEEETVKQIFLDDEGASLSTLGYFCGGINSFSAFGKTVFLTREAAEAALKDQEVKL